MIALALSLTNTARAQLTEAELDAAEAGLLKAVAREDLPRVGNFYSWQRPWHPPAPWPPLSAAAVYELGGARFLFDDRAVSYSSLAPAPNDDGTNQPPSGSIPGVPCPMSAAAYGCALWLQINPSTNNQVLLTLHNTRQGQTYTIWSITNLSLTNWVTETNITGASGNFTQTLISMSNRPIRFFRASEIREYSPDTNATFTGLAQNDILSNPPDTMGAVGPSHFVELINGSVALYDKTGELISKTNTLDFFRIDESYPSGTAMFDPRILFDHHARCWVAAMLDKGINGSGQIILAVNTNAVLSDLTTSWFRRVIQVTRPGFISDFTTLGLDDNGLYLTVLQLGEGLSNGGHTVVAVKKPEIYAGHLSTNRFDIYASNSIPVWTVQPAVNFDDVPTNGYAWLVAKGPPDLSVNYRGGGVCYRRLQWIGTNATLLDNDWILADDGGTSYRNYYDLDGTNVTVFPLPATGVSAPHRVAECEGSGAAIDLHYTGSRLANTVIRHGVLWTCQTVGLNGTNGQYAGSQFGTNVDRSGIQWLRMMLESSGGSMTLANYGRVYDSSAESPHYFYFGSLMVNCSGDMVTAFSGSAATNYISAFFAARNASSATTGSVRLLRAGTSAFCDGSRWGDYSATTLDPEDDWSLWPVQQYAAPDLFSWQTVIARIRPQP